MKLLRNSLYLKLLGWFVAANLLAIIATIMVMRPLWDALDKRVAQVPEWGETAALLYETEGAQALRSFLRELRREHRVFARLKDADGQSLLRMRPPRSPHTAQNDAFRPPEPPDGEGPEESRGFMFNPFSRSASHINLQIRTSRDAYRWEVFLPPPGPDTWHTLGWVRLAIFLGVMALAALLFTLWLGRPIKRLRLATEQMATGDLGVRADDHVVRRRDEIGELGQAFNRMADRLQTLVGNKERLLRDVSHELRSPLARLEVALELARERSGGTATRELDRIDLETQRLKALIDQVMTLVRLDDPEAAYQYGPLNISELLASVCDDLSLLPEARLQLQSAAGVRVNGNSALLRSALENVIRNAVKYTAPGSGIEIGLTREGGDAVIRVRDQGPGVADAQLDAIFRPFYRTSEARTPNGGNNVDGGGYGVGLAIVKRVMQAHDGQVLARNRKTGGLEVSLRIPLAD